MLTQPSRLHRPPPLSTSLGVLTRSWTQAATRVALKMSSACLDFHCHRDTTHTSPFYCFGCGSSEYVSHDRAKDLGLGTRLDSTPEDVG